MAEKAHAVRNGFLCALAFLVCALIAHPFVQMGFMDDWSYIWSAREFAHTGHFAYVWSSPILGWQLLWGSLFIRLFGFSFNVVRLSALPVAMLSIFLFHSILLRFGITARNAVIGALTFGLSPLFLPIATSFMTDVPGICSILLCIYLCQRAAEAQTSKATVLWLLLAASTNLLSGTVRQTSWLGLLIIIPSTAVLLRRRRGVLLAASLSWIAGSVFIYVCLRWFGHQPGSLHEHVFHGIFKDPAHPAIYLFFQLLGSVLLLLLLVYPLLMPWLPRIARLRTAARVRILAITSLLSLLQWKLRWMLPWLFYVIVLEFDSSKPGPVLGKDLLTFPLPPWLRIGIAAFIIVTALIAFEYALTKPWQHEEPGTSAPHASWREVFWIIGPYSLCYTLLLVPRGLYNFISDRYLLGLLPIVILLVIMLYQQCIGPRLPHASFVGIICFTAFAVAGTHDWFAAYRARLTAINELRSAGAPRAKIQGGFEYDSWTQVENLHFGYKPLELSPFVTRNCAPDFTPLGAPPAQQYTVIYADKPCLAPSTYPPVSYRAWLPPFQRQIRISEFRQNQPAPSLGSASGATSRRDRSNVFVNKKESPMQKK
ncbi:MAG TPA: hypothetical protein VME86_05325 [Acidobacteriaceae bacterium]|nr:hypothetical protein [Acidobacteriaceae bacterium]